ncbi:MAG: glycosyltransferase family 2 protein [Balneolaceae bacterium]|nr:MAG: glycosyltransferase family 2 protein [Balneolaceae bacterium]
MNQNKPSVSIIILTSNGLPLLKRYLPFVNLTNYPELEILIADNGSNDGTQEWVSLHYPHVRFLRLGRNYGYAEGNNLAARSASGEILLFLNNDAKPEDPDWLSPVSELFASNDADIVQPKMLSVPNPGHFDYAGAAGGFLDWLGYPFCRGRIFDSVEKDSGQYDKQVTPVFWASGAAFAIRKDLFLELEGFDTLFRFHMEEIDLCWRALRLGKRILFQPKSVVLHQGGGSLRTESPDKTFFNYRNSLLMLVKNLERYLFPKLFLRLLLDGVSGIRFLIQGRPLHTVAVIRAHFSFYASLKQVLRYRTDDRHRANAEIPKQLVLPRLIILQRFLYGKKVFSEVESLFVNGRGQ